MGPRPIASLILSSEGCVAKGRNGCVVFAVFLRAGVAARWYRSEQSTRKCTHAGRACGILTTMFLCSGVGAPLVAFLVDRILPFVASWDGVQITLDLVNSSTCAVAGWARDPRTPYCSGKSVVVGC
jgi:hypothetical protein